MPKEKTKRFYWGRKLVTEKVYKARLNQQQAGRNVRSIYGTKSNYNLKCEEIEYKHSTRSTHMDLKDEGYKLVNIEIIAKQLVCKKCNNILSLLDATSSTSSGLGVTYYVVCTKCKHVNDVLTDKQHNIDGSHAKTFNCNTKAVLGTLNGGGGLTSLNKLLSVLGVSPMNPSTFRTHQTEIGQVVEQMVEESCTKAALEERELTIQNSGKLKTLLPDHLQNNFIFPGLSAHDEETKNVPATNVVRVGGSFDMGWPTKGSGRSYDSLSGTAGYIGLFSKKLITQIILNRKCRLCDLGHPKSDHDCKLNCVGSAKAMEPKAAALLVSDSNKILKACNIQIGIFIGDCDSSAIQAARSSVDYEIVKLDDINHTGNTVISKLYKSIKLFKELNSTSIKYLGKCFNYCVAQNKGDIVALADGLRNIPYHCFNLHRNCGEWCKYSQNPTSYKHAVIGEGFQDPHLFDLLVNIFDEMAEKANQFVGGVSSNANESLNALIASKSPKSILYGTSISYNLRVGLSLLRKNEGERFVVELLIKCQISPTKKLKKFCQDADKKAISRYDKAGTASFKKRRLFLKQTKSELRHKHESVEGTTYKSSAFLKDTIVDTIQMAVIDDNVPPIIVYFDLETGSLSADCDILQIAAKYKEYEFSVYITPAQKITEKASMVNGLTFVNDNLQSNGKPVITVNLQEGLISFYQFMFTFKQKCILTAHNCAFDSPRLLNAITKTYLDKYFQSVVCGFSDTLPIIRKLSDVKSSGHNKLENIAQRLKIKGFKAHNALDDVIVLNEVIKMLKLKNGDIEDQIIESSINWLASKQKIALTDKCNASMKSYDEFKSCTSVQMRKRMISADITINMVVDAFKLHGFDGLTRLLGPDENGEVRVTKNKKVKDKLFDFLKKKY